MNMEETGEKAAARHFSPSVERNQQGISDLRAILSIASSRGVKVVLVTTPTWRTYRDRLDSTQLSEMVNTCEGMARTIAGVEYFNFHDDPRFLESDFEDADHLSASGCVKFSKLLGRSISAGPSTPRPVTEQTRSK
jgi:hypothetical protein